MRKLSPFYWTLLVKIPLATHTHQKRSSHLCPEKYKYFVSSGRKSITIISSIWVLNALIICSQSFIWCSTKLISLNCTFHDESNHLTRQIWAPSPVKHRCCSFWNFKISFKQSGICKNEQQEKVAYRRYLSKAISFASFR